MIKKIIIKKILFCRFRYEAFGQASPALISAVGNKNWIKKKKNPLF